MTLAWLLQEVHFSFRNGMRRLSVEPVLSQGRWSWDKWHIDFDLNKKPPELLMTATPRTGNGSIKINSLQSFQLDALTYEACSVLPWRKGV